MRWKMNPERAGEAMLRAGVDLKTLAADTGISARSVSQAIKGRTAPRPSVLAAICKRLGVDPVSVCDRVEEPETRGRKPAAAKE